MDKNIRDSSIEGIEGMYWGTHICQIYDSMDDILRVAIPFLRAGLINNEMCLWIYTRNADQNEIINSMSLHINNIEKYVESGQLLLLKYDRWYLEDNSFNEVRVNKNWREYIDKATKLGYDGLRAVADTSWLDKCSYRTFEHYEHNANEMIKELPFIVLCLYDQNKSDVLQLAEIINNHGYTIIKTEDKFKVIKHIELLIRDKQLNSLKENDKIKTEFLANLSHELRTPLNIIMSAVQMLELDKNSVKDERINKYLKLLKQNSYRLTRLINNIIDLTKIEADYYNIRRVNHDIINLLKIITMSVADYAFNKGITINFKSNVQEKVIACDPDKIERIMLNLLSNAIKFTQYGGKINVIVKDCGHKMKILVKDNGIGIPLDKQKVIFNRFEQVDKNFIKEHEGSGIGLSLVKALVEKHDGNISLSSIIDKGTEFAIEIPCTVIKECECKKRNNSKFISRRHSRKN